MGFLYRFPVLMMFMVLLLTAPLSAHAQETGEGVSTRFIPRGEVQLRMGTERTINEGKIWVPLAQEYDRVLYGDGRISGDWDDNLEGNIGFGYRTMEEAQHIIGGSIWYDYRKTERGSRFSQITLGGEIMTRDTDARLNVYLPISGATEYNLGGAASTTPYLADTGIYYDANGFLVEKAQRGVDLELGYRVPIWQDSIERVRVLGAVYGFTADDTDSVFGGRIRTQVDVTPDISVGARFQHDGARGPQAFADLTVRFPFGAKRSIRTDGLRARMDEFSERDIDIVTFSKEYAPQAGVAVLNAETGQMQRVIYVDNSSAVAGDGSFENPYNDLALAQADLRDHDTVYVFSGTGDSTRMDQGFVIDKTNVSMIGEGVDFVFEEGRYLAPRSTFTGTLLQAAGANPILTNVNAPADSADLYTGNGVLVTGDDAYLAGFSVENASYVGIRFLADGVALNSATASRVHVEGSGSSGIVFQALDGGSYNSVRLENSTSVNNTALVTTGSGIVVTGSADAYYRSIILENNSAHGNAAVGININFGGASNAASRMESVFLSDNITNNNTNRGLSIGAARGRHENIVVDGHHSENNTNEGVYIVASSGGVIEHVELRNITTVGNRDGVGVAEVSAGVVERAVLSGLDIQNATRDGLSVVNVSDVVVRDAAISNSARYGVYGLANDGGQHALSLEDVSVTVSGSYGVMIDSNAGATPFVVDLGGGVLGSTGGNRIFSNTSEDVYVNLGAVTLKAENNWWGDVNGLQPARVLLVGGSLIDANPFLTVDPGP